MNKNTHSHINNSRKYVKQLRTVQSGGKKTKKLTTQRVTFKSMVIHPLFPKEESRAQLTNHLPEVDKHRDGMNL